MLFHAYIPSRRFIDIKSVYRTKQMKSVNVLLYTVLVRQAVKTWKLYHAKLIHDDEHDAFEIWLLFSSSCCITGEGI